MSVCRSLRSPAGRCRGRALEALGVEFLDRGMSGALNAICAPAPFRSLRIEGNIRAVSPFVPNPAPFRPWNTHMTERRQRRGIEQHACVEIADFDSMWSVRMISMCLITFCRDRFRKPVPHFSGYALSRVAARGEDHFLMSARRSEILRHAARGLTELQGERRRRDGTYGRFERSPRDFIAMSVTSRASSPIVLRPLEP